jgi:hypothetical protein
MLFADQIADGDFNFTSIAGPSQRDVTDIESDDDVQDERELEKVPTFQQGD